MVYLYLFATMWTLKTYKEGKNRRAPITSQNQCAFCLKVNLDESNLCFLSKVTIVFNIICRYVYLIHPENLKHKVNWVISNPQGLHRKSEISEVSSNCSGQCSGCLGTVDLVLQLCSCLFQNLTYTWALHDNLHYKVKFSSNQDSFLWIEHH